MREYPIAWLGKTQPLKQVRSRVGASGDAGGASIGFRKKQLIEINDESILFDIFEFETRVADKPVAHLLRGVDSVSHGVANFDATDWSRLENFDVSELVRENLIGLGSPKPPPVEEGGFDGLSDIELNIAQICNLACDYCCVGKGSFGSDALVMASNMALKAVDEMFERTSSSEHVITFFGGEPLLNLDVVENVAKYASAKAESLNRTIQFRLLTNGAAFSARAARAIKRYKIQMQISIDGDQDSHDRWRVDINGNGTQKRIIKSIRRYFGDSMGLITVRVTLTKGNLDAFAAFNNLKMLGFERVIVAHANGHFTSSSYSQAEVLELKAGYKRLAEYFLEQALANASVGRVGAPFNEHLRTVAMGQRKASYCGAGQKFVGVSARGKYYYCQDMAENPSAQVGDLESGLSAEILTALSSQVAAVDSKPVCRTCWVRYICGGGCAALAAAENGDIASPYVPDCEIIRHNIGLSIWILHVIQSEKPESFLEWR